MEKCTNLEEKNMIKRSIAFVSLALALSTIGQAQSRKVINLPSWDFSRDGKAWSQVAVPHDWAIAGPFDKKMGPADGGYRAEWRKGENREVGTLWSSPLDWRGYV